MTAALLAAAAAYARHAGAAWPAVSVFLLLLTVPAADVAISLAQRMVAWAIPPHRLPRLDFSKQLPDNARTMVVVPTMLTSTTSVAALLEHIEVLALGNLDPRIHFAILSDLVDANARDLAGDPPILAAARDGIERLNRQFGTGHADRFFLFHRERSWNAREQAWMGWERKRGKIEEFNKLLRGASDTSFTVLVGELAVLPSVRYCITLDTDTRLPRDGERTGRHHRASVERAALRRAASAASPRATDSAASRERHHGERRPDRCSPGRTPVTPAWIRIRRPSRTSIDLFNERHLHRQGPLRRRRVRGRTRRACPGERPAVA
jgi:hypothetical protein